MAYVFHMIKRLTPEEELKLRYREILDEVEGVVYADVAAREAALTSVPLCMAEERERMEQKNTHWTTELEGWDDA